MTSSDGCVTFNSLSDGIWYNLIRNSIPLPNLRYILCYMHENSLDCSVLKNKMRHSFLCNILNLDLLDFVFGRLRANNWQNILCWYFPHLDLALYCIIRFTSLCKIFSYLSFCRRFSVSCRPLAVLGVSMELAAMIVFRFIVVRKWGVEKAPQWGTS